MAKLVALGEAPRTETPAAVVVEAAPPPQLPAALELCLKKSMRPRKAAKKPETKEAADALVLAELKGKRDREVCAYQLFTWHQEQRAKAAQKVAGK